MVVSYVPGMPTWRHRFGFVPTHLSKNECQNVWTTTNKYNCKMFVSNFDAIQLSVVFLLLLHKNLHKLHNNYRDKRIRKHEYIENNFLCINNDHLQNKWKYYYKYKW